MLLLALMIPGVPAFAETTLAPHQAVYKLKVSIAGGRLTTELVPTADGYIATHMVKPTGMAKLLSRGRIREVAEFADAQDGVIPRKYQSTDTLSRDKERVDVRFDWDTREVRGTFNDAEVISVLEGPAHDRVSIQYELMHDLLSGSADSQYIMYEVDKIRTIEIRNVGTKTVKVPAGRFEAVGIQHQAVGSKRITTMWCAEELGYLPVIIEQHRLGKLKARSVLAKYLPLDFSQEQ